LEVQEALEMDEIRVLRCRKIFSDNRHNAFTTLAECGGRLYLAFRSGTSHLAGDGFIRVLASGDGGESWSHFAVVDKEDWDLRDPHLIFFRGRLHLFYFGRGRTQNASFHSVLQDGIFSPPELLTGIPMIWGLCSFDGNLFATAYQCGADGGKSSLYASADGSAWSLRMRFPFPGTETAIDFDANGTLWALVRDSGYGCGCIPTICRIDPPYTALPKQDLQTMDYVKALQLRLTGPMLKRFPGRCLIAGRMWDGGMLQRRNLRTDLFLLEDGGDIRYLRTLPSGGDTSYASFLNLGSRRALLSYYSSHEYKMDVPIPESPADIPADPAEAEHTTPADVFLAELSYRFSEV